MKYSKTTLSLLAGLAMVFSGAGASAAPLTGLIVEGGGTAQIYQLDNGNLLGLWGFDNRGAGTTDQTFNSAADIIGGFISNGGSIQNFYEGTNPINPGASEFDPLQFGFTVAAGARLFDSLWIEWTGGNLVYGQPGGRRSATMGTTVTRQGDPLAAPINPVSLPATTALLGLGLLALVAARRRQR